MNHVLRKIRIQMPRGQRSFNFLTNYCSFLCDEGYLLSFWRLMNKLEPWKLWISQYPAQDSESTILCQPIQKRNFCSTIVNETSKLLVTFHHNMVRIQKFVQFLCVCMSKSMPNSFKERIEAEVTEKGLLVYKKALWQVRSLKGHLYWHKVQNVPRMKTSIINPVF